MSTIKQRKAAAAKVAAVLVEAGFVYGGGNHTRDTAAGKLSVSTWSNHDCSAIFMRFDDPHRAEGAGIYGHNPFSGKWNIHERTAEQALGVLRERLARVLEAGHE